MDLSVFLMLVSLSLVLGASFQNGRFGVSGSIFHLRLTVALLAAAIVPAVLAILVG